MGNFLAEPVTEKDSSKGNNDRISYGYSSMQGYRRTMEDRHSTDLTVPGHDDIAFFAVFDGHAGDKAAAFCGDNLVKNIVKQSSFPQLIEAAIVSGFLETDALFRKVAEADYLIDGTTAVSAFITKDKIIVANCGDSRCVLSRGGTAVPLSDDHKPANEGETARIVNAGGMVSMNRVQGELAVSRALGDFVYKGNADKKPEEQMVIAVPDVTVQTITPQDEFIILACDGLWDVMSSQEAVDYVREALKATSDLAKICEMIIDASVLELGSKDNVSCVIVVFNEAVKSFIGSNPQAVPPLPSNKSPFLRPAPATKDSPDL